MLMGLIALGFALKWSDNAKTRPRQWRAVRIPIFIAIGIIVSLTTLQLGHFPFRWRFALSRAALTAEAQAVIARGPGQYPPSQPRLGWYHIGRVGHRGFTRDGHPVIEFVTYSDGTFGCGGFIYIPDPQLDSDVNLPPGWYTFACDP